MKNDQPKTRIAATAPRATRHLHENQKQALDVQADAEHSSGVEREKATRQIEKLAGGAKSSGD